jgi:hypothetical protein
MTGMDYGMEFFVLPGIICKIWKDGVSASRNKKAVTPYGATA